MLNRLWDIKTTIYARLLVFNIKTRIRNIWVSTLVVKIAFFITIFFLIYLLITLNDVVKYIKFLCSEIAFDDFTRGITIYYSEFEIPTASCVIASKKKTKEAKWFIDQSRSRLTIFLFCAYKIIEEKCNVLVEKKKKLLKKCNFSHFGNPDSAITLTKR